MEKIRKQFKRIKREHEFIDLQPVQVPDTLIEPISFMEQAESEHDSNDWSELEEPLCAIRIPEPHIDLDLVSVQQFVPDPVVSFTNDIDLEFIRYRGTEVVQRTKNELELPLICPRIPHNAKPVALSLVPLSTKPLASAQFKFQIEVPENDVLTEVELVRILRGEMKQVSKWDCGMPFELPITNSTLPKTPKVQLTSLSITEPRESGFLLKQHAEEVNMALKQSLFQCAPSEYNEFLFDLPNIDTCPIFYPVETSDIDILVDIDVVPIDEFTEIELTQLPWNSFKSIVELVGTELKMVDICQEKPEVSSQTQEMIESIYRDASFVYYTFKEEHEREEYIYGIDWAENTNRREVMGTDGVTHDVQYSAMDAVQQFMFLKGKQIAPKETTKDIQADQEDQEVVTVDPMVDLYRNFSLDEHPTYKCIISSDLFKRSTLIKSLEQLRFELIERELICSSFIVDANNIILFYNFRKLLRTDNLSAMVKSELGQLILTHALKFSTIHVIFEQVQPEQDPNKLRVYPFTPPVIKTLELLQQIHYSILRPEFQTRLRIWYSDTDSQTAWIARMIGHNIEKSVPDKEAWLLRDYLLDDPTTHEEYLARFPGLNNYSARLLLKHFCLKELFRLEVQDFDFLEPWIDMSKLVF